MHVTIDYRFMQDDFRVVSTGNYGVAKRKIEAIFEGVSGAGAGSGLGHPTYYTPSNIKIEGDLTLTGVSLLTERDILIQGLTSPTVGSTSFKTYNESDNTLHFNSNRDNLRNWDSTSPHFVQNGNDGFWNTQGRLTYVAQNGSRSTYDKPGFAALGKICGYTVSYYYYLRGCRKRRRRGVRLRQHNRKQHSATGRRNRLSRALPHQRRSPEPENESQTGSQSLAGEQMGVLRETPRSY